MDPKLKKAYSKLKTIRERKDLKLKPTDLLLEEIEGLDGSKRPLVIRYYQVQGVLHFAVMNRFLLADDTGIGKTIQSIAGYCYVYQQTPVKTLILTKKSITTQWAAEFEKFCGNAISTILCIGNPKKREKKIKEFEAATGPTAIIMGYPTAKRDIRHLQNLKGFLLITDEAQEYSNPSTQTHQVVKHLSQNASRMWALTATPIENSLTEAWGIFSVLVPGLLPHSRNGFMNEYCVTQLQPIPGTTRKIPVIIGHRKSQITRFKKVIDPFMLARSKMDVASELPVATKRIEKVALSKDQRKKYNEALAGLLEIDQTGEEKDTSNKLTALIYCQQIANHPALIDCDGGSKKMDRLFELLTEEFKDQKIIVFSRFRKMIDILEEQANKLSIPNVRITGSENDKQRKIAMKKFQTPGSKTRVCFITTAAAEGINLQAAKAIIFYDTPWSGGKYLQIIGRMIRIGSVHDRCYAIHLVAKNTIDLQVMKTLGSKMELIEQIIGKRLKGDESKTVVRAENDISALFDAMKNEALRQTK